MEYFSLVNCQIYFGCNVEGFMNFKFLGILVLAFGVFMLVDPKFAHFKNVLSFEYNNHTSGVLFSINNILFLLLLI